jgi:uncharacterized protein (TIGR02145 family)
MRLQIRHHVTLLTLSVAVKTLLFAACSHEESTVNTPTPVQFAAGSIAALQTRTVINGSTGATEWTTTDRIGIYMLANGGTLANAPDVLATNVEYVPNVGNNVTSGFSPASTAICYPASGGNVDFIAYYPFGTPSGGTIDVQVDDQSDPAAIDLLWAKATNSGSGYNKNTGTVGLSFAHALSKLTLDVQKGEGVASLEGMTVAIKGMNTWAELRLEDGAVIMPVTPAGITPRCTQTPTASANGKYEAILLPVAGTSGATVEFTIGTKTYTWDVSTTFSVLQAGHKYDATITVKQSILGISITGNGATWTASAPELIVPDIDPYNDLGVEIDGVIWATRNVGIAGAFLPAVEEYGYFYQWNKPLGWDPYTPGSGFPMPGWNNTEATGVTWASENDPCPSGWRVPNSMEWGSLLTAGTPEWAVLNGFDGMYFGTAPNRIFLPAGGYRDATDGQLMQQSVDGCYWSSSSIGGDADAMLFSAGGALMSEYEYRAKGYSVRCVKQ